MINRPKKQNISVQQVLAALLDDQTIFPPAYLHQFSDLEGVNLEALRSVWPQVSARRRYNLLEDLENLAEVDTLVSFDNVARMALEDSDPRVRTIAIRLLWENEDPRLAKVFIRMLRDDEDAGVRAAAATALGLFVYLGELEEIPQEVQRMAEEQLMQVLSSKDETVVRRRALESLGYSGRQEMAGLIRKAYESDESDWISSALYAMGRSADSAWGPEVTRMLRHPMTNVQLEAVRAAGELELEKSRRTLLQLLEDENLDVDVRSAAIWSLSQIGGEDVRETLENLLDETEDDEEAEILETALDNLSFTEDVGLYGMFDFMNQGQDAQDEGDEDYLTGLEEDKDKTGETAKKPNRNRRPPR